jgi:hypothetical protein
MSTGKYQPKENTAINGKWVAAPGEKLFKTIKKSLESCRSSLKILV